MIERPKVPRHEREKTKGIRSLIDVLLFRRAIYMYLIDLALFLIIDLLNQVFSITTRKLAFSDSNLQVI